MMLDLRFTPRSLDSLWCQAVVALVFQEDLSTADGLSGLDAKTSGYLSSLNKRGFWTGAKGEILLVPSQGMIKADKMLLKGLGARADYSLEDFSTRLRETGYALEKMGVNDLAIRIPLVEGLEDEYPSQLKAACVHLVAPFLLRHKGESDFLLKIVVSMDETFIGKVEDTVQLLKEHFSSRLDCTIICDRRSDNAARSCIEG